MWQQILGAIEEMRRQEDVVLLFPQYLNGEDLFGLNEPAIIRVLESLNYLWLSIRLEPPDPNPNCGRVSNDFTPSERYVRRKGLEKPQGPGNVGVSLDSAT